jgi:uncharacterized membrane protein YbhN (UPF0104 family)
VYYVRDEREKFARLLTINPTYLALLVGVWVLLSIPRGLIRKLMAQRLGVKLAFVDWYGLFMVTNLISLVVPARGDFIFSAAYLKKKYGLPISQFGSMVYGSSVLLAVVLCLEGCLGLFFLGITENIWDLKIWGIVIAVGMGAIPFAMLSKRILKGESWLIRNLRTALEGWETLRSDPGLLIRLVALIVTSSLIFTMWMYVSYRTLGFEVSVIPVFLAGVATQMSFFLSLTPGNLGVREAIVGFISQVTRLGFAEGVAVTILQRAVSTAVFFIFGGFFSLFIVGALMSIGNEERVEGVHKGTTK